ncbi:MAG: CHRD domain-containing protein [Candidatus Eiseniibacteriota bacterium]
MRPRTTSALVAVALYVGAVPAQAAVIGFSATINGAQEVPANASPASGTGTFSFDDVTKVLSWNVVYSGLTGTENAAHFHAAPIGVAGPVRIGLPLGSPKVGSAVLTPSLEAELLSGLFYVNVHTSPNFSGGEIRGQLERSVPAVPGSWGKLKALYK